MGLVKVGVVTRLVDGRGLSLPATTTTGGVTNVPAPIIIID